MKTFPEFESVKAKSILTNMNNSYLDTHVVLNVSTEERRISFDRRINTFTIENICVVINKYLSQFDSFVQLSFLSYFFRV